MIDEFRRMRIYLADLESQIEDVVTQGKALKEENGKLKEVVNKLNNEMAEIKVERNRLHDTNIELATTLKKYKKMHKPTIDEVDDFDKND